MNQTRETHSEHDPNIKTQIRSAHNRTNPKTNFSEQVNVTLKKFPNEQIVEQNVRRWLSQVDRCKDGLGQPAASCARDVKWGVRWWRGGGPPPCWPGALGGWGAQAPLGHSSRAKWAPPSVRWRGSHTWRSSRSSVLCKGCFIGWGSTVSWLWCMSTVEPYLRIYLL